jgi:hypothetical protein
MFPSQPSVYVKSVVLSIKDLLSLVWTPAVHTKTAWLALAAKACGEAPAGRQSLIFKTTTPLERVSRLLPYHKTWLHSITSSLMPSFISKLYKLCRDSKMPTETFPSILEGAA